MKVNLFVNFYNDPDQCRQEEINECVLRNTANPLINRICLVVDSPQTNFYNCGKETGKIEKVIHPGRPAFSYFFGLANSVVTDGDISIFSNIDIYFDEYDVSLIRRYMQPSACFALSRWEKSPGGRLTLFDREDSQDSWIFKGPINSIANCDFSMGRPGCDNAISQRIEAAGYRVCNPSRDIKSIHVHNSGVRHYDPMDKKQVVGKPYRYIRPARLSTLPHTVSQS